MAGRLASQLAGILRATSVGSALMTRRALAVCALRETRLLLPRVAVPSVQVAGIKVKDYPKRRCQYCFFIRVNGRIHIECTKYPSHKQRQAFNTKLLWW